MRQILVPAILVSEGYDETMGESVVQLLGAGIPTPFEILDEWQASAQIAKGRLDGLHPSLWGSVVELEQHDMPINTASLCHKNLLIFLLDLSHKGMLRDPTRGLSRMIEPPQQNIMIIIGR